MLHRRNCTPACHPGYHLAAGRWPMALPVDAMQIVIYITDQSVIYMHHHT